MQQADMKEEEYHLWDSDEGRCFCGVEAK